MIFYLIKVTCPFSYKKRKTTDIYRDGDRTVIALSYTRMRELFIEAFSSFGPNIKSFGLHSLRAGGATAACNFGISDRLFK